MQGVGGETWRASCGGEKARERPRDAAAAVRLAFPPVPEAWGTRPRRKWGACRRLQNAEAGGPESGRVERDWAPVPRSELERELELFASLALCNLAEAVALAEAPMPPDSPEDRRRVWRLEKVAKEIGRTYAAVKKRAQRIGARSSGR